MERKPDYKGATHFVEQYNRTEKLKYHKNELSTVPLPIDHLPRFLASTRGKDHIKTVAVFLIKPKP